MNISKNTISDFSLSELRQWVFEKKSKLHFSTLSSRLPKAQFERLVKSGILEVKEGRATISGILVNHQKASDCLKLNTTVTNLRGRKKEYGNFSTPRVNVTRGKDFDLLLAILENWIATGLNENEALQNIFNQRDDSERAKELGLELEKYKADKKAGFLDWIPNRAYSIVIDDENQLFRFVFNGEKVTVKHKNVKRSRLDLRFSFDWTTFLMIMSIKNTLQTEDEIKAESDREREEHYANEFNRRTEARREAKKVRVVCTSYKYNVDGEKCGSIEYRSDDSIIFSDIP